MAMRAGKLDRRINIQSFTEIADAYGEPVKTWANFAANVPAQKRDLSGREYFEADKENAERMTTFIIRFLSGVNETMRIVYESNNYDIISIAEIGRREGLELRAELQVDQP